MLNSEKRSLVRFLVIYLASTLLLFTLASWIFFLFTKHHLLDTQRDTLRYESEIIKSKLRILHQSNTTPLLYPKHDRINSVIFDKDKNYIFGTEKKISWKESQSNPNRLYYVAKVEPYYLGAAYLLTSRMIDYDVITNLKKNIFLFMLGAGVFFFILAYYLGHLFIAPMRDSIRQMNRFIQDTTHELNTPISTILTNIELIETFGKYEANHLELKRIEIASKTLNRIYDDLTYLNLNHQYHRNIIILDMSTFVEERIVYFTGMIEAKNLTIVSHIEENIIRKIDKNDAMRLVDNLISNAIKYNKHHGLLDITLTKTSLIVKDTGIGIDEKNIAVILHRFKRANKSEGGFGIGLDIVNQVIHSYGYILKIKSKIDQGTEVEITWKK